MKGLPCCYVSKTPGRYWGGVARLALYFYNLTKVSSPPTQHLMEVGLSTAAVATAAVALRAEVSRGQRRCVELMKTVSLDREKPLFLVLSSALFGY